MSSNDADAIGKEIGNSIISSNKQGTQSIALDTFGIFEWDQKNIDEYLSKEIFEENFQGNYWYLPAYLQLSLENDPSKFLGNFIRKLSVSPCRPLNAFRVKKESKGESKR